MDYPTSTDMVVQEGSNVSLRCVAAGSPEPSILWKREDGEPIFMESGEGLWFSIKIDTVFTYSYIFTVNSLEGPTLNLSKVSRHQMGPYLCIASNGIPPSVSKRIMLIVHCKSNFT